MKLKPKCSGFRCRCSGRRPSREVSGQSFFLDQTGQVEASLDKSGIFSSLNPRPSTIDLQAGQRPGLYPHRAQGGPARRRSKQKREFSRPLADSLEAQSPQSSEGGGRVFCGQTPEPGFCPPSSTRFAREVNPLPAGRSSLPCLFLLFIFLRASATRVRSGSDERARDQSFLVFQPDPLC